MLARFLIRLWLAWTGDPSQFPCDPVEGPAREWTRGQRQGARELATAHLRARGARPNFLAFVDAATIRESSGRPSVRHDGGAGVGLHGLNVRYHGAGRNLCDPRESAEAVRELARRCIRKYGDGYALVAWDLQACYAGRFECIGGPRNLGTCTTEQQDRTTSAICSRMEARGFSCYVPIHESDLGQ